MTTSNLANKVVGAVNNFYERFVVLAGAVITAGYVPPLPISDQAADSGAHSRGSSFDRGGVALHRYRVVISGGNGKLFYGYSVSGENESQLKCQGYDHILPVRDSEGKRGQLYVHRSTWQELQPFGGRVLRNI